MRVIFAGTPDVAVPSLQALVASPHEVVAVLTRADAPQGRGRKPQPSPVRRAAEEFGIPVHTGRPRDPEFLDWLAEVGADVAAVVAYGEILPARVLDAVPSGWVNLHFSLLPQWRGAAPAQRAIIAGDDISGATTFLIRPALDSGPVLGVLTQTIGPRTTAGELLDTLAVAGAPLLVASLDALASGQANPVEQPSEGISIAPKLTVAEGEISWQDPAQHIDRLVRGFTPEPGAWTVLPDGLRLGVGPVVPASAAGGDAPRLEPGQIQAGKHQVWVGTGSEPVVLTTVRPQGKKEMAAADWARGARLAPYATFGEVGR